MTTQTTTRSLTSPLTRRSFMSFTLGVLAASQVAATHHSAVASQALPVLSRVTAATNHNVLVVHGLGFTPGGQVHIVVLNRSGAARIQVERWVRASTSSRSTVGDKNFLEPGSIDVTIDLVTEEVFGANGSQDPAQGYQAAIDLSDLLRANELRVRAYDVTSHLWSDLVAVALPPNTGLA